MRRALLERGCPRCWTPMPLSALAAGKAYCGSCALEFTAAVFEPVARAAFQPPDANAVAAAQCAKHPRNAAVAACDHCGAFICSLCRVDSSGTAVCTSCFEKGQQDDAQGTTYRDWRSVASLLLFVGLFAWVLGIIVGPAIITAAIAARRQARRWGEPVSIFTYGWIVILGLVETGFGAVFVVTLLSR